MGDAIDVNNDGRLDGGDLMAIFGFRSSAPEPAPAVTKRRR